MIDKTAASELLNVNAKTLSKFERLQDPYNLENNLSGYICHQADYRYGSLVICEVNDRETEPQLIFGIPKIKYPFFEDATGKRIYQWGKIDRVEAYNKFDGTNVVAYRYRNAQDRPYTTFKLRLYPYLRDNRFGPLKGLWDVCMQRHPGLVDRCREMPDNFFPSFEMFGYRNSHMVVYEDDITFMHLCMIGQGEFQGKIDLPYKYDFINTNIPVAQLDTGLALTQFYESLRDVAHRKNGGKTEYGELQTEGYVMYAISGKDVCLFKIKPEEVEDIAWAKSTTIPEHAVESTCWNAFEHTDEVTKSVVETLLEEDYARETIEKFSARIDRVLSKVLSLKKLQDKVTDLYATLPSEVKSGGKATILRALSPHFEKAKMKQVYLASKREGILE